MIHFFIMFPSFGFLNCQSNRHVESNFSLLTCDVTKNKNSIHWNERKKESNFFFDLEESKWFEMRVFMEMYFIIQYIVCLSKTLANFLWMEIKLPVNHLHIETIKIIYTTTTNCLMKRCRRTCRLNDARKFSETSISYLYTYL